MRKKRIGVVDAFPAGACSFYRSFGPLSKMDVDLYPIERMDWIKMSAIDILYVFRPDTKNHLDLITIAKNMNVPVIVDWDDNVLVINHSNPGFRHFDAAGPMIIKCLQVADYITVSTQAMKDAFTEYNKQIAVVPNAFNDYNFTLDKKQNSTKEILWRGSATHRDDLLSVADSMVFLSEAHRDYMWTFVGGDPWYVADRIKNSGIGQSVDVISYFKYLKAVSGQIMQIPLTMDTFNASKSNIAWIEGTYAGCACVAPDLPEFVRPGISNYADTAGYQYQMEKLMGSNEYRQKQYELSREYILSELTLSSINGKRDALFDEVI